MGQKVSPTGFRLGGNRGLAQPLVFRQVTMPRTLRTTSLFVLTLTSSSPMQLSPA